MFRSSCDSSATHQCARNSTAHCAPPISPILFDIETVLPLKSTLLLSPRYTHNLLSRIEHIVTLHQQRLSCYFKPQLLSHRHEVDCWITVFFRAAANWASFAVPCRQDLMDKLLMTLAGRTVSQISSCWSGTHPTKIGHQQTMIKGTERSSWRQYGWNTGRLYAAT